MSRKFVPSQADLDAFYTAMKDVKPIQQDKIPLLSKQPQKMIKPRKPEKNDDDSFLVEEGNLPAVLAEDELVYAKNGISNKILRKLRKGQYNVEAVLDLHHMTVNDASVAISRFMEKNKQEGAKVILIIHGKGYHSKMPVLKNKLNNWLRNLADVLAFCTATAKHGGRGAVYVLLKQNTQNRSITLEK